VSSSFGSLSLKDSKVVEDQIRVFVDVHQIEHLDLCSSLLWAVKVHNYVVLYKSLIGATWPSPERTKRAGTAGERMWCLVDVDLNSLISSLLGN